MHNACICWPFFKASWVRVREAAVSSPEVSESSVYPCAGGEVEGQVPADEVLLVAANVPRDRRAGG